MKYTLDFVMSLLLLYPETLWIACSQFKSNFFSSTPKPYGFDVLGLNLTPYHISLPHIIDFNIKTNLERIQTTHSLAHTHHNATSPITILVATLTLCYSFIHSFIPLCHMLH